MAEEHIKEERLERDMVTKEVYHFIDTEAGINQISKEIYKKKDLEVHYPRGYEGGPKYKTIKKFSFLEFGNNLPVGIIKSPYYGYGFTKPLWPFSRYIDDNFDFTEVVVEKNGETKIDGKTLYLSDESLRLLHKVFSTVFAKNNAEIQSELERIVYELFPNEVKKPEAQYIENALSLSLSAWGNSIDEFSDDDKEAIKLLFEKLSTQTDFLSIESLRHTKEIVDVKFIDSALQEFEKLFAQISNTSALEKKWQKFLKDNSWIFSSIFAQPVILYQDEAYAGGKAIDNKGGKLTDFLIKNSLSDNVSFFEIKTHKTKLLENKPYRGKDVFSTSKELAGSINQVLNQRDKFQKTYANLKLESDGEFETINSACVVLIGSFNDLSKKQKYSFELFRSNSRDVEVITFDEVKTKIQSLRSIIAGQ